MFNASISLRSMLAPAIGAMLIVLTPVAHANAKGRGRNASIITSTDGGGGANRPVIRDHRGDQSRTRPVRQPRPICAGWAC